MHSPRGFLSVLIEAIVLVALFSVLKIYKEHLSLLFYLDLFSLSFYSRTAELQHKSITIPAKPKLQ